MQYGVNRGRGAAPPIVAQNFCEKYILVTVKFHVVCLRVPLNLVTVDNFRIEIGHEPAPEILATGTIWGE